MSRITVRTSVLVTSLVALVFSFNLLVGAQDQPTPSATGQSDKSRQSGNTKQSGTNDQKKSHSGKDSQNTTDTAGQTGMTTGSNALAESDRKFIMEVAHDGMAEVMLGKMATERAANDEVKRFGQRMVDDHTKANQELMQLASTKGITLPAMTDMSGGATGMSTTSDADKPADKSMSGTQTAASGSEATGSTAQTSGSQTSGTQTSSSADRTATSGQTSATTMSDQAAGAHGAHMSDDKHHKVMNRMSRLSGADFDREYMKHMVKDHEDAVSDFQKQSTRAKDPDIRAFASKTLPTLQEHLQMARDIESKVRGGSNPNNTSGNSTSGNSNSTNKRP